MVVAAAIRIVVRVVVAGHRAVVAEDPMAAGDDIPSEAGVAEAEAGVAVAVVDLDH